MVSFLEKTLNAESPSLWEEIWDYLYKTYFAPETLVLDNLGFGSDTMRTIVGIVFGLLFGVIAASVFIIIDKRVLGDFVRKLLGDGAISPDSAKTLSDLGFLTKFSIRSAVRKNSALRSVVRCREEEEYALQIEEQRREYEEKRKEDPSLPRFHEVPYRVDPDTDHFYIPEDKKYSAEMRFEKKGTNWGMLALVVVVCLIIFVAMVFLLPEILRLVNDLAGAFSSPDMIV